MICAPVPAEALPEADLRWSSSDGQSLFPPFHPPSYGPASIFSIMPTLEINPSYGDEFSPRDLNMAVLKQFMSEQGLPVIFMRRRPRGNILIKIEDFPPASIYEIQEINNVPVEIHMPYNFSP